MLELVLGAVVSIWVVAGGVAMLRLRGGGRLQLEADGWARAARTLELTQRRALLVPGLLLEGDDGGCAIRVTRNASNSAGGFSAMIRVAGPPTDVQLRPAYAPFHGSPPRIVETGDGAFDTAFVAAGREEQVRAALDETSRRFAINHASRMFLEGGRIELALPNAPDGDTLVELVRGLVALATRFSASDVDKDIAHIALNDPEPGVRFRCLKWLVEHGRLDDEGLAALRPLLEDPDAETRLIVAQRIGREAVPALQALVRDPQVLARHRAEAFDTIVDFLPAALRATLVEQLSSPQPPPALAARMCESIERDRLTQHAEFVRVCIDDPDYDTRFAAVRAAERVGDASWVPALIERLDAQEYEEITAAACAALEVFGTAEAVAALRATSRNLQLDRCRRRAAEDALEAIQARAGEPGRLSVIGADDTGAVSFAPDDGALSLKED